MAQTTNPLADGDGAQVQFWHWWNSAGESQNISVLRDYLKKNNLTWAKQSAQNSSSGLYLSRIEQQLKLRPPEAAMMDHQALKSYDDNAELLHLDDIAKAQDWDEVIPLAIQQQTKRNGHWIAAPLNSHSTNWLWINKALFSRLDLPEPDTWDDLIAVLERAQALGIPALATPRDDWERGQVFELVVMSTGGLEFYRRLFVELDFREDDRRVIATALLRLQHLQTYFSDNTQHMSWDQASAKMAHGQVLMQIHGSWVNSELTSIGAQPNVDYLCMRFPGTQGAYIFYSDHVGFFKATHNNVEHQKIMARILLDKDFQRDLSMASGAAPARVDISSAGFNHCSKKSIYDLRMANMRRAVMPSINHGALWQLIADYLQQQLPLESAVNNLLDITLEPAQLTPAKRK